MSGTHLQSLVVSDIGLDDVNIMPSQLRKLVRSSLTAYEGENGVPRISRELIDKFKLVKIIRNPKYSRLSCTYANPPGCTCYNV
jgi:hypothetical protein